jgi:DNA-binding NtrC family response regulator
MKQILVASAEPSQREVLKRCFGTLYKVDVASDRQTCLDLFQKRRYEFLFVDLSFLQGGSEGHRKALQTFWQIHPNAEIIVLCSHQMIREAVDVVRAGASNYLTYPIDPDEAGYVVHSILEYNKVQQELDYLRDRFWQRDFLDLIRTESPTMKKVFEKVRAVAPTDTTVMITGQTGTGKGVLARLIHSHSLRKNRPFISVHCSAIPDTLLESELFGHEKGAFTGAVRRKPGKFEIAQGGTMFLDEIGTVSASTQSKLLQVLQERRFQRVGGEETIESDVRIIAATNADILKMSDEGHFRPDLFYRLNVFPLEIPPLRERLQDIPALVDVFLRRLSRNRPGKAVGVHPKVLDAFRRYHWPGNIRELENLIERAYILEKLPLLTPASFPTELFGSGQEIPAVTVDSSRTLEEIRRECLDSIEKQYLVDLLSRYRGRIDRSAEAAGIGVRQLHKLLKRHNIRKEKFKPSPPAVVKESEL